jgi:GT2 family glycosyltransferase
MGISRKVFEATGGFHFDRFAEDIEFSIRMKKAGFSVGLISEAFVYHRRRATFAQFFRQVFNFGKGRAQVGIVHPTEVKLTHWFPTIFTVGCILLPLLYLFSFPLFAVGVSFLICYLLIIFFHSLYLTRRLSIAALSVISALLQLWGYGVGFAFEKLRRRKSPAQKGSEG